MPHVTVDAASERRLTIVLIAVAAADGDRGLHRRCVVGTFMTDDRGSVDLELQEGEM